MTVITGYRKDTKLESLHELDITTVKISSDMH